jgi:ESCRT-II complex subunit VPS25
MSEAYEHPPHFHFPPFFTLQPVPSSRAKQLQLWGAYVADYASAHGLTRISISEQKGHADLFSNEAIERRLTPDAVRAVLDHLVACGQAVWDSAGRDDGDAIVGQQALEYSAVFMCPKPLAELALEVIAWSNASENDETISTINEMASGELDSTAPFAGLGECVLLAVLKVLVDKDRVVLIEGDNLSETGVKFIS